MEPSLQDEWDAIFKMFSSGQFLLARILKSATACFASEAKAAEAEAFFKVRLPLPPPLQASPCFPVAVVSGRMFALSTT